MVEQIQIAGVRLVAWGPIVELQVAEGAHSIGEKSVVG